MTLTDPRAHRLLALAVAATFAIAACSSGAASAPPSIAVAATPTAVPTARPTAKPTPKATAKPTASPSPSPKPGAVAAVKIGAPYKLVDNPANLGLSGSISMNVAGQQILETISGREIRKSDKTVGTVLALEIEGYPMTEASLDQTVNGAVASSGGKAVYSKILGKRVATITMPTGTGVMFHLHDAILLVVGLKSSDTKTLATAIIKANQ